MIEYQEISNTAIRNAIDDYIHKSKYREILGSRLIDGLTFDELADKYGMSVRQIANIIGKYGDYVILKAMKY